MLKKNQEVILQVTDVNNLGYGVSHHEGMTVFVGGAVDHETVRVKIITVKKTYAVGRIVEILHASPDRIAARCSVKGCGGCAYREVSYSHERELKWGYVLTAFRKAGLPDVEIAPLVSDSVTQGYRNKAQYPVSQDANGAHVIGFYASKSHRVVEAAHCPLQPPVFHTMVEVIRTYLAAYQVPAYREESGEGLIRHIYLRRGTVTEEVLCTLVVREDALPCEEDLVRRLTEACPTLVGVLVNVNPHPTNVICGDTWRTIWGRSYLVDVLAGISLHISPSAFYQVNHNMAEKLYEKAKELACLTGEEQLIDLYCGAGSIGLSMASHAKELIGVEIVPEAVENAKGNASRNNVENAYFYCGDAGDARLLLDGAKGYHRIHPDVVVLDPPRKGCDDKLLAYLFELGVPRIVYISCNPDTLARDAKYLTDMGYRPTAVTPYDLFPGTGHVECVMAFTLSCEEV